MASIVLFDQGEHRNILLEEHGKGTAVQANQHLIIHKGHGILLDPGGHKVYNNVLSETFALLGPAKLTHIFLSHQDPDIIAATNGWLMTTDAEAYISALWLRFVPHFGLDRLVEERLKSIPDEGMTLEILDLKLKIIPAHFLHACGNFQLFDPVSRILYTGDLGASLGQPYRIVPDFDAHLQYMEGFHRRYMSSRKLMAAWARMARQLDPEIIAPQHGAMFKGKAMVKRFIDWCEQLECGIDLIDEFKIPA